VGEADEIWPRYNPLTHASISLNRTDKIVYNTPDSWIGPAHELAWNKTDPGENTTRPPPTIAPPPPDKDNTGSTSMLSLTALLLLTLTSVFSFVS